MFVVQVKHVCTYSGYPVSLTSRDCMRYVFRDTFDRGSGFREHIQEDHNMWSYVWFKIYLESKDIQLLTGSEFYAYTQMQSKQVCLDE